MDCWALPACHAGGQQIPKQGPGTVQARILKSLGDGVEVYLLHHVQLVGLPFDRAPFGSRMCRLCQNKSLWTTALLKEPPSGSMLEEVWEGRPEFECRQDGQQLMHRLR